MSSDRTSSYFSPRAWRDWWRHDRTSRTDATARRPTRQSERGDEPSSSSTLPQDGDGAVEFEPSPSSTVPEDGDGAAEVDIQLPSVLAEAMFVKLHLMMDIFNKADADGDGHLTREEVHLSGRMGVIMAGACVACRR